MRSCTTRNMQWTACSIMCTVLYSNRFFFTVFTTVCSYGNQSLCRCEVSAWLSVSHPSTWGLCSVVKVEFATCYCMCLRFHTSKNTKNTTGCCVQNVVCQTWQGRLMSAQVKVVSSAMLASWFCCLHRVILRRLYLCHCPLWHCPHLCEVCRQAIYDRF